MALKRCPFNGSCCPRASAFRECLARLMPRSRPRARIPRAAYGGNGSKHGARRPETEGIARSSGRLLLANENLLKNKKREGISSRWMDAFKAACLWPSHFPDYRVYNRVITLYSRGAESINDARRFIAAGSDSTVRSHTIAHSDRDGNLSHEFNVVNALPPSFPPPPPPTSSPAPERLNFFARAAARRCKLSR